MCFTQLICVGHVPITVRAKINMVKGKLFISVDHISAPSDVLWRFIRQELSVRAIASELQQLGFTDSKSTVQRRVATMQRQSCIVSSVLKKKAKLLDQRTEDASETALEMKAALAKCKSLSGCGSLVTPSFIALCAACSSPCSSLNSVTRAKKCL